jgi:hypothetical protein
MSEPRRVPALVKQGIAALQAGDRATAHELLAEAAGLEPRNQTVLLWLSDTLDNDDERRAFLNQVIELDPESREGNIARKKLARLGPPPAPPQPPAAALPSPQPPAGALPEPLDDYDYDFPPLPPAAPPQSSQWQWSAPESEQPRQKIPPLWVGVAALAVLLLLAWSVNTILNDGATGNETVLPPTETLPPQVPPTTAPPTTAPPTAAPPTAAPPTAAPPTAAPTQESYPAPPTTVPPQGGYPAPPTAVPPQDGYPAPPTTVPPQGGYPAPPTTVPPQDGYPGPLQPTAVVPATPTSELSGGDVSSDGLGLSRDDWEQSYGEPTGSTGEFTEYNDGIYRVSFSPDVLSYLGHDIQQEFGLESVVTLEEGKVISEQFMPDDSKMIETQQLAEEPPAVVIETYRSEWLSKRLPITIWGDAEPGTFTVRYELENGNMLRYTIQPGNP